MFNVLWFIVFYFNSKPIGGKNFDSSFLCHCRTGSAPLAGATDSKIFPKSIFYFTFLLLQSNAWSLKIRGKRSILSKNFANNNLRYSTFPYIGSISFSTGEKLFGVSSSVASLSFVRRDRDKFHSFLKFLYKIPWKHMKIR